MPVGIPPPAVEPPRLGLLYRAIVIVALRAVFWLVERRFARGLTTADRFWPPVGAVRRPSPALRRNPA